MALCQTQYLLLKPCCHTQVEPFLFYKGVWVHVLQTIGPSRCMVNNCCTPWKLCVYTLLHLLNWDCNFASEHMLKLELNLGKMGVSSTYVNGILQATFPYCIFYLKRVYKLWYGIPHLLLNGVVAAALIDTWDGISTNTVVCCRVVWNYFPWCANSHLKRALTVNLNGRDLSSGIIWDYKQCCSIMFCAYKKIHSHFLTNSK